MDRRRAFAGAGGAIMSATLKQLRYDRTRASNRVRATIAHLLTDPIKWDIRGRLTDDPTALPSWWPFWSDVLKTNVREAVRAGLALEAGEVHASNLAILEATERAR
jgi:hypothetical protein